MNFHYHLKTDSTKDRATDLLRYVSWLQANHFSFRLHSVSEEDGLLWVQIELKRVSKKRLEYIKVHLKSIGLEMI